MAKDTTSPFSPGRPVPVEFFVGRMKEIEEMRRRVRGALSGRLEAVFVAGERGIGKSSLASFMRHLCEKEEKILAVHAFLGGVDTLEGAVRMVFDQLARDSADRPILGKIKKFLGNRVSEAGLFGVTVKFDPKQEELHYLVNNFVSALRKLIEEIRPEKEGFLLILDDLNGLVNTERFPFWLKSVVDEISTSASGLPVCLMLVGLEERRRVLVDRNPSVARIFRVVDIRPWDNAETRSFFGKAFSRVDIKVDQNAIGLLSQYAGGLPVLAHEIGDAAFNHDKDGQIDGGDAVSALFSAAEVVGRKYLDPVVFQSIRSTKYRSILRTLTDGMHSEAFSRADIKQKLGDREDKVLDNFLQKMKKLGVIAPEGDRGIYRFSNSLHYLYFFMEAERAKNAG